MSERKRELCRQLEDARERSRIDYERKMKLIESAEDVGVSEKTVQSLQLEANDAFLRLSRLEIQYDKRCRYTKVT